MDGILNFLKPPGMTSHDVVAWLRRLTGEKRIGHTGTLDPAAAGVLVLCLGSATRLTEFLLGSDKAYRAEVTFGLTTSTGDSWGEATSQADASRITREGLLDALGRFRGEIEQVPPMVSAVKVGGRRLYEMAREGLEVEREPRRVTISSLELIEFRPGPRATAILDVVCSKGTYVRTLCADLGRELGPGACMAFLLRTRSGPFDCSSARTAEELLAGASEGRIASYLEPPSLAVGHLPAVSVSREQAAELRKGRQPADLGIRAPEGPGRENRANGELLRLESEGGELVAVAEVVRGSGGGRLLRTRKVFT